MTRTTMSGRTLAPEQRVTLAEAIDMYTRAPAFAAREEHCRGQIAPGYLADLVGLATDPREVSADAIGDVAVTLTVVDGVPVHLSDN
jgi:predicted amidohydrolase YtcJ